MRISIEHIDRIERCYSNGFLTKNDEIFALFASERAGGECMAYSISDFSKKEIIWQGKGGTMALVEVPQSNGEFLAVQNFFPGFQSAEAKIVWCRGNDGGNWIQEDFVSLPYVHRFDILPRNGVNYFIACSLCSSKQNRDDWSDPGKVYTGLLPDSPEKGIDLGILADGLIKNHGYWRGRRNNAVCGFVSSESGIMAVIPPDYPGGPWEVEQLIDKPISDMAVFDIDGDGEDEIIAIEPFHGDSVKIYHKDESQYSVIYEYPREIVFAHALWAGKLRGRPSILLGGRRQKSELVLIQYDPDTKSFNEIVLEEGKGPSNVSVLQQENRDIILCANNTLGEAAAFMITD